MKWICCRLLMLGLLVFSTPAFAQRTVWVSVMVVYQAPDDAIDWRGPWTRGKALVNQTFFASEGDCRKASEQLIRKMNEGMKVPFRYQCAPFMESIP